MCACYLALSIWWNLTFVNASAGFSWSVSKAHLFIGTEAMALINFVTYLVFAIILVVLQNGVSDQLGIGESKKGCLSSGEGFLQSCRAHEPVGAGFGDTLELC